MNRFILEDAPLQKTPDLDDLISSIKNGRFTKDGSEIRVRDNLFLYMDKMHSLIGCPQYVEGDFDASHGDMEDLTGAPRRVKGSYQADNSGLKSVKGGPEYVSGDFDVSHNEIESFKDVHKHLGQIQGKIYAYGNPIKSHILGFALLPVGNKKDRVMLGDGPLRVASTILNDSYIEFPGTDQKSLKQRLMYASRRLIAEVDGGKELAQL